MSRNPQPVDAEPAVPAGGRWLLKVSATATLLAMAVVTAVLIHLAGGRNCPARRWVTVFCLSPPTAAMPASVVAADPLNSPATGLMSVSLETAP